MRTRGYPLPSCKAILPWFFKTLLFIFQMNWQAKHFFPTITSYSSAICRTRQIHNLYHMSFYFRELSNKYIRLYGLGWFERPWSWGHVYMGPFEYFLELYKLVSRWTKLGISKRSKWKGLYWHFEGRSLEWPILLFSKLGHLRERYWTLMS